MEMKANSRECESVFRGFESHQSDGVVATTMTSEGINDMFLSFDCNGHRAETLTAECLVFLQGWGGCLTGTDDVRREFTHSFFLDPQDNNYMKSGSCPSN